MNLCGIGLVVYRLEEYLLTWYQICLKGLNLFSKPIQRWAHKLIRKSLGPALMAVSYMVQYLLSYLYLKMVGGGGSGKCLNSSQVYCNIINIMGMLGILGTPQSQFLISLTILTQQEPIGTCRNPIHSPNLWEMDTGPNS